jgi:hypothetical protein
MLLGPVGWGTFACKHLLDVAARRTKNVALHDRLNFTHVLDVGCGSQPPFDESFSFLLAWDNQNFPVFVGVVTGVNKWCVQSGGPFF